MQSEPKLAVAEGYDRVADVYLHWRERTPKQRITTYLDRVTELLPQGARVLDLGCGGGVPYTAMLSGRFDVTGVDISAGQVALARRLVPGAVFLLGDMSSLAFRPGTFGAIIALYSIIHVPREEHEPLLQRLFELLRPGGRMLAVLGRDDWGGREPDWLVPGVEMYWSHFDAETNRRMVERAGFRTLDAQIEPDPLDGAHLFVLAEKPA